MKCPKCGLINAPTAVRCDCGLSFGDGSFVAPPRAQVAGEKLRRAGCTLGIAGMLTSMLLRQVAERGFLLAGVLGDLLLVAAFIGLALWIIGTLRARRRA